MKGRVITLSSMSFCGCIMKGNLSSGVFICHHFMGYLYQCVKLALSQSIIPISAYSHPSGVGCIIPTSPSQNALCWLLLGHLAIWLTVAHMLSRFGIHFSILNKHWYKILLLHSVHRGFQWLNMCQWFENKQQALCNMDISDGGVIWHIRGYKLNKFVVSFWLRNKSWHIKA